MKAGEATELTKEEVAVKAEQIRKAHGLVRAEKDKEAGEAVKKAEEALQKAIAAKNAALEGHKAGDAEKLDDVDKRQLEMERKKRDSHARYMRYYRSIRSRRPTCMPYTTMHACITCTCAGMCVLCIHAMRSDPNTPPELRQMSREAHGSALSADFKIQHCIEHLQHACMIMHA